MGRRERRGPSFYKLWNSTNTHVICSILESISLIGLNHNGGIVVISIHMGEKENAALAKVTYIHHLVFTVILSQNRPDFYNSKISTDEQRTCLLE